MNASVFRRYLQPSPTLRWHPWAPLAFGLLLLAFVFYVGAMWGFSAGDRIAGQMMVTMPASDVFFRHEGGKSMPAHAMVRDARKLDLMVHDYIVTERNPPGLLRQWRDRAESVMFFRGHSLLARVAPVNFAELRLSEYSAANPRWQATSTWCTEMLPRRSSEDLVDEYRTSAAEYSQLLGRTVRAEDLAPAVPGGKCTL